MKHYSLKYLPVMATLVALACVGATEKQDTCLASEQEVEQDIALWSEKTNGKSVAMWEFMTLLCEKVNALSDKEKKRDYYRQMSDRLLKVKFEDHPAFPLETWGTEPLALNLNDPKSDLRARHRFLVMVMKELYHGLRESGLPLEEQFSPVFRFAEKVEAEKFRLKALDIDDASKVLGEAERDLYELTRGDLTEEKKKLLNGFERAFYRPLRTPEEIDSDQHLLEEAKKSAMERMMRAFKTNEGIIRHGENWRKWIEVHGVPPGMGRS